MKALRTKACIVCGGNVAWNDDPNPACRNHLYGAVIDAIDKKRARSKKRKGKSK
jgi:hypothetical protein